MASLPQLAHTMTSSILHTTITIAERYKSIIDWKRFFTVVKQLGDQCNGRKDRFDKADIFEQAIEVCSNGKLKWVDEIGRDHRDTELNLDIEFKFQKISLFTPKNKKKGEVKIKIKNSLGKTTSTDINNPAHYYMFAQENAVGIISYAEMKPYLKIVGDGLATEIPHDKIIYIINPIECETLITNSECMNYKERKLAMQREFINSIPPSDGYVYE
jgi:hypothetical protein